MRKKPLNVSLTWKKTSAVWLPEKSEIWIALHREIWILYSMVRRKNSSELEWIQLFTRKTYKNGRWLHVIKPVLVIYCKELILKCFYKEIKLNYLLGERIDKSKKYFKMLSDKLLCSDYLFIARQPRKYDICFLSFYKAVFFTHLNTRKTNFKNWGTCKYFSPVVFGAVCKLVFIARSEFVEFNETMQIVFNAK